MPLFAGPKHVMLRVVSSDIEHQIITTSPEELLKIREMKKSEEELRDTAG